jgi:ADP-ribose pyrophosphatase
MLTFYLAEDCRREGPGGGDGSEDITVHTVPLDEVDRWLADAQGKGYAFDPKVYTALYWLERRPGLPALLPIDDPDRQGEDA